MKSWAYGELLRNLVGRDLKLRYRNTGLGFLWSFVQPLTMFFVYYTVFGLLLTDRFGMSDYPLLLIVGLFAFNFFSSGVTKAVPSVVQAGPLLRQVSFPRFVLPLATVTAESIHFLAMLFILLVASLLHWLPLRGELPMGLVPLLALPVVFLAHFSFTLGLGLLLSTFNVFARDTEQLANTIITIWFFATPVFYPPPELEKFQSLMASMAVLPEGSAGWFHRLYYLNPMAHIIKSYRDILLDHSWPEIAPLSMGLGLGLGMLFVGQWVFRRNAHRFAEEI
ncbi:ABC transporter permease [bacterium]|nr:ABC transporter permease [bacterium]